MSKPFEQGVKDQREGRVSAIIRDRLAQEMEAWSQLGVDYSQSPRTLILEVGRVWKGVKCDPPVGEKNECYRNAGSLALDEPERWSYVEGLAVRRADFPILIDHGWLLDRETGEIHDPTWGESDEAEYVGLVFTRLGHTTLLLERGVWDLLTWASADELREHVENS